MEIIALPDIHGDFKKLDMLTTELEKADLTLLVGDITNFGREKEIKEILELVSRSAANILAVSGNCDYPEVEAEINAQGLSLNGKCQVIDSLGFIGLSGSLQTPFNTPSEFPDGYFQINLEKGLAQLTKNTPLILASHQPPRNTSADRIKSGLHVGSENIRAFIERYQPLVCFTGHIHEGVGIDQIGKTKVVNPGAFFQGKYAKATINANLESLEICTI